MEEKTCVPDSTAVRVALWRALHVQIDEPPHVLSDEIGFQLVAPEEGWRNRPDMHPQGTSRFRASIVARSRYIEDFIEDKSIQGISQFVLLGSGLDTFAQRRTDLVKKIKIFEIEKEETLAWKRERLIELGYKMSSQLHFVSVNFESGESWWNKLFESGFNPHKPAVIVSTGVSMYLTKNAITETLRQMSKLVPGSTFMMTYLLPLELVDAEDKFGYEKSIQGAKASGTPFISMFSSQEMIKLAHDCGLKNVRHLSTASLAPLYFANRKDGLKPSSGEEFLIATL